MQKMVAHDVMFKKNSCDAEINESTVSVGYLVSLSSESPRGLRMEMAGEDEGY